MKSLLPVVSRPRERFGIARMCVVADRGMISVGTIAALEAHGTRAAKRGAQSEDPRSFAVEVAVWAERSTGDRECRDRAKPPCKAIYRAGPPLVYIMGSRRRSVTIAGSSGSFERAA